MRASRAVIFDLDDTLYPEREYVLSGFRAIAAWAEQHANIPADAGYERLRQLFEEGVRGDTINRWLESYGIASESLVSQLVQVYRQHQPALTPFSGVPELLESLRDGYQLGLVSDGYLSVQKSKFAGLNLANFFDAVVFSDAWGRAAWKPSTKPFEEVLRRLGPHITESVYVADNPQKDFLGPHQLGMATVRLCVPGGEYSHLRPPTVLHRPQRMVNSIRGLRLLFQEQEIFN